MGLQGDGGCIVLECRGFQKENILFQFFIFNLGNYQQVKIIDFNCLDWYIGRMIILKVKNFFFFFNQLKKVDILWYIYEFIGEEIDFKRRDE